MGHGGQAGDQVSAALQQQTQWLRPEKRSRQIRVYLKVGASYLSVD